MNGQVLDNSQLESALEEFAQDRQKDSYAKVMEILEKSAVLVPSLPPQGLDQEAQEAMRTGETVHLSKDVKVIPCLLKKSDGGSALPIFSSAAQIPPDKRSPVVLTLSFAACLSMVMANQEHIDVVALNPFTHNMVLSKAVLEVAVKRLESVSQAKGVNLTPEQFRQVLHNRVMLYLLPMHLFKEGEEGLERLRTEEGAFLVPFYKEVYPQGNDAAIAQALQDFSVMTLNVTDDMQILRLDTPSRTEKAGMCYRVYVVLNRDTQQIQYYTLEKTKQGSYFGRIMPDGTYERMEPVPDNGTEIEAVIKFASAV